MAKTDAKPNDTPWWEGKTIWERIWMIQTQDNITAKEKEARIAKAGVLKYTYKYVDLPTLTELLRPLLSQYGVGIIMDEYEREGIDYNFYMPIRVILFCNDAKELNVGTNSLALYYLLDKPAMDTAIKSYGAAWTYFKRLFFGNF
ncbi:MAG: hypothetical protein ACLFQX_05745, partial [Candidatus Kapaibacterium sp.]